ncbi:MAG TPA: hypothetical protein VK449_04115 [Anaerolineales bacterium]|nr:hypothetical protein [Anaerolineales bacterium]
MSDFIPGEGYRRLVDRWYLLVVGGLVGALLGLLVSLMRPPLYEASAVISLAVDRTRAQIPDTITVRQAYDRVRGLLLADDILDQAVALAGANDGAQTPEATAAALRRRLRLSEEPEGWELTVISPSGQEAERLAQAWADSAIEGLTQATAHAIRAAEWQKVLFEASCALATAEPGSSGDTWRCTSAPAQGNPEALPASILAEVEASRGILPVLNYSMLRGSQGTGHPVTWDRGTMVLGGALIGFLLAAWVVAARKR